MAYMGNMFELWETILYLGTGGAGTWYTTLDGSEL